MEKSLLHKRIIVVAGKGGVGKSFVSAAICQALASHGKRVLLASIHRDPRLSGFFGAKAAAGEIFEADYNVWAVNVTPAASMKEYGLMVLRFETLYKKVFEDRLVKYILQAIPSLEELVMIGKVWYHTQEKLKDGSFRFDTVVMDAQATGHAISMLSLPKTIAEAAPPGVLKSKAEEILSMITNPAGASLCVVTTPEEMPVNEAAELFRVNQTRIHMPPGWLFMNRVIDPVFTRQELDPIPDPPDSRVMSAVLCARFRAAIASNQSQYLAKARKDVAFPSIEIPEYFRTSISLPETVIAARAIKRAFTDD